MAEPNYDLLNQVQYFVQDPNSPLMKQVREELAPLEQKATGLKEGSPEYQRVNAEYQRKAAAALLNKIQAQFGGAIPDRKAAEDFDYARRAAAQGGGDAEATIRQGSAMPPYAVGYNILEQLQKIAGTGEPPEAKRHGLAEPGAPTKVAPPAPKKRQPLPTTASDDEKLSEAQLGVLYGLAQTGKFQNTPQTLDEVDAPDTGARLPYAPREAPERTAADATPEQLLMENYKRAFEQREMSPQGQPYAEMPLPPGWVRAPSGVPVTNPGDDTMNGRSKEAVEADIRRNMYRLLAQEAGSQ